MADEGYERAYRDALAVLYLRGKVIGKSAYSKDGIRCCDIDRTPLTDREILKEAWGEGLANEIIGERNGLVAEGCRECERLWERYADMMSRYLAIIRQEPPRGAGIDQLSRRVMDIRDSARKAVLDHIGGHRTSA